jgi:hypothetical protein
MTDADLYLVAVSTWVVIGNVWHFALLTQRKGPGRPVTISEHAVENKRLLLAHRIIHSLPLLFFPPLVFYILFPQKYYAASVFLLTAAIFDSVQTLTLNKQTAPLENKLNFHSATAWIMAVSYFAYSGIICYIAGVSLWVYGTILSVCILLLISAVTSRSRKHFLVMQMSYFILLSTIGLLAHSMLILA